MMASAVTSRFEAVLNVDMEAPDGRSETLSAVIDTGFGGFIALPLELIAKMGLRLAGGDGLVLADGNEASFRVCDIVVHWHERPLLARVQEADAEALIGMALLRGSRLTMDIIQNGSLQIEAVGE